MSDQTIDPLENLRRLLTMVDTHSQRVTDKHRAQMRCQSGCTACCRQQLSVARAEAHHILSWLLDNGVPAQDPAPTDIDQHPLFDALSGQDPCVFLGPEGKCGIYPVRPIICRTHGLPIDLEDDQVDTCPLNFDGDASAVPQGDRLNLKALNTRVALIESIFCQQTGQQTSGRFELAELRRIALKMISDAQTTH